MLVPTSSAVVKKIEYPRKVGVFGSSGSIGKSSLDVISQFPEKFSLHCLTANSSTEIFAQQIKKFRPKFAVIRDESKYHELTRLVSGADVKTEILSGEDALLGLAASGEFDVMLAAIVGFAGLSSVIAALESGKTVALANKESLVSAGLLVSRAKQKGAAQIIPVDSEHSAIFQLINSVPLQDIKSITLTASGGPFLYTPLSEFKNITPAQAIKHPKWSMGPKISIDSASMFNKALELIEAHWLFDLSPNKIKVTVHPQSIVHSMVNFIDGVSFAQMSEPDMKGPISYALNYPGGRLTGIMPDLDLAKLGKLEFLELDAQRFPAVNLARRAVELGGLAGAVFNIANEIAVNKFMRAELSFDMIGRVVENALDKFGSRSYSSLEELSQLEKEILRDS